TVVVLLEAGTFSVASDVHPVAGPAFTVGGAGEEIVEEFGPGVGSGVGHEAFDFLGGGGEAGQVEEGASDEGAAVGLGGEGEALCGGFYGGFGGEEPVDGMRSASGGWGGVREGLEGPPLAVLVRHLGAVAFRFFAFDEGLGVGGSLVDPRGDGLDRGVRKARFFFRHEGLLLVPEHLEHPAFVGVEGDDGGAVGTALEEGFAGAQIEFALHLVPAVTLEAVLFEEGLDFAIEGALSLGEALGVVGRHGGGGGLGGVRLWVGEEGAQGESRGGGKDADLRGHIREEGCGVRGGSTGFTPGSGGIAQKKSKIPILLPEGAGRGRCGFLPCPEKNKPRPREREGFGRDAGEGAGAYHSAKLPSLWRQIGFRQRWPTAARSLTYASFTSIPSPGPLGMTTWPSA
ncbi:MAG: hypothetical protein RLZZ142_2911, partial [Verrucomicrobiota bacterium]